MKYGINYSKQKSIPSEFGVLLIRMFVGFPGLGETMKSDRSKVINTKLMH